VLANEKAKLDQLEHDDQDPAAQAVDEYVDDCLSIHVNSDFTLVEATPKKLVDTTASPAYTPKNLGDTLWRDRRPRT
jgi:hypothetical protein